MERTFEDNQSMLTERQRILLESTLARDTAESLLQRLVGAKAESERRLGELRQADALKKVTGRSAMDNAIVSTQRMIETLNRSITQLGRELQEEDVALFAETEATVAAGVR
jgi:hypothetical protein